MKVLLGYFIRRSIRDAASVRGKTFAAYGHRLFPDRRAADDALARERVSGGLIDERYTYDVAEAWMHVEEEPAMPRPRPSGISDKSCPCCGAHHVLGEFEPGSRVRTRVDRDDRPPIPAGTACVVREWSQYGSALYYRVHVDGDERTRENYSPCELEAMP